jgi:hypothetical protein
MSSRVGSRSALDEIREGMTQSDLAVVAQVAELRMMSGRQIEAAFFAAERGGNAASRARQCRRALARLVAAGVLSRLERRVGGVRAGSASYVYTLGVVGHRLLDEDRPRPRRYEPTAAFVKHQLAVSQLVVDLTIAARSGLLDLIEVQGEPRCWRTIPAAGRALLRPDLYLEIGRGDLEYRWFVELDRATHHRPALVRKARVYEGYYRSGIEQADGGIFPRVLWIARTDEHAARLREVFAKGAFTKGLMIVATANTAVPVAGGGQP